MIKAATEINKITIGKEREISIETVTISIIVTLQNMAKSVNDIYQRLLQVFDNDSRGFEIIFVDDGSTDTTAELLVKIQKQDHRVRIVKLRNQFGEAASFDAGLRIVRGHIIVYFTGRVNPNPKDLPGLLRKLEAGFDMVLGWRYPRRDSKLNQIVSLFFNRISSKFGKVKLHDMNSGVIVTRKDVLKDISFYGNLISFIPVIANKQGYKITEVQVEQLHGSFSQSLRLSDYIRRFLDIITVIFLTNYSKKPLHFLGFLGALFTILGLVIDLYLFIYRILGIGGIAGRPLLLLGVLLLVVGIQMISIGLLGEMIIFTHARKIKEYNIKEILG